MRTRFLIDIDNLVLTGVEPGRADILGRAIEAAVERALDGLASGPAHPLGAPVAREVALFVVNAVRSLPAPRTNAHRSEAQVDA